MPAHPKLTQEIVREIRRRYSRKHLPGEKVTQGGLAAEFSVNVETIRAVIHHLTFRYLSEDGEIPLERQVRNLEEKAKQHQAITLEETPFFIMPKQALAICEALREMAGALTRYQDQEMSPLARDLLMKHGFIPGPDSL